MGEFLGFCAPALAGVLVTGWNELFVLPTMVLAGSWSRWPVPVLVVAATGLGGVVLCSIGVAQWLELRRHLRRPGRWVAATAVAWFVGLLVFFAVASPLWHQGQHPVLVAGIGAFGGLSMAVSMATTTGLALTRLVRSGSTPDPGP